MTQQVAAWSVREIPDAVMDTSAWVAAWRAEIGPNLLDLFRLIVPEDAVTEIEGLDPAFPKREYPPATLFRHMRQRMTVVPSSAGPPPLANFGRGEAAALALALARGSHLLINERRGARHGVNLGLRVLTIPSVVVLLHLDEVISRRAAHRKLNLIVRITAPAFIDEARQLIDAAGLS